MGKTLQEHFPSLIRTREEVKKEIEGSIRLRNIYYSWEEERQEEFLDFCSGVKGVNVLYDFISKAVLDPEATPERLNDLLSVLLNQKVKIKAVLPLEGGHIADERTLIVMDLLVELEDGRLADFEIQKIGYKFPGERAACYASDLLLRQYKRIRGKSKQKIFKYSKIKDVYAIILFERSTKEFNEFPDVYIHRFKQKSDSGIELKLLQNFIFIPLDIYQKNQQNKRKNNQKLIENRLDAWLNFFGSNDPEVIAEICEKYPDFKEMYHEIYVICRNLEDVMTWFSEELMQMDINTEKLMFDEMQEELDQKREELNQKREELDQKNKELYQAKKTIENAQLIAMVKLAIKKIKRGYSTEQIAEILEEDPAIIQSICEIAEKYQPGYDTEKICAELLQK